MPQSQTQPLRAGTVVLTGDLVASSKLAPEELVRAMAALSSAAGEMMRAWGGAPSRFETFRGDGWQCLGPEPRLALRAALVLRASLSALGRAFDTRISVGIGGARLGDDGAIDLASGPAFELSGRALDTMEHARRFAVAWEAPPEGAALHRAIFALCDEISRNWTPGQARVFARLLVECPRPNQEAIARSLDITQQTVATHLAGGGDWALQEALKAVEE